MFLFSESCVQARSNLYNAVAQTGQAALPESGQRGKTQLPKSKCGRTQFFETARSLSRSQGGEP